jgi:hypothetical protein
MDVMKSIQLAVIRAFTSLKDENVMKSIQLAIIQAFTAL